MLLSAKIDFGRVLKMNPISKDRFFRVHTKKNSLKRARLGISLPKNKIKNAITRNNLKRKIRNSLQQLSGLPLDIVFVYINNDEPYDAKITKKSIEHHKNKILNTAEKNWKT